MRKERALDGINKWLEEFVVGKNICPFSRPSFESGSIHFAYSDQNDLKKLLKSFWEVLQRMEEKNPTTYISNSLFVIDSDISFLGLLEFGGICEEFLVQAQLSERYQIVEFHPDFLFTQSEDDDAANYVNRSPLPFIHVLRVQEVAEAISRHKDVHKIPLINAETLRAIGSKELHERLEALKKRMK